MSEVLQVIQIILSVLILPMLKLVSDMRVDIAKLTAELCDHKNRIVRLENNCDAVQLDKRRYTDR